MRSFTVGHVPVFLFIPLMLSLIGTAWSGTQFQNDDEAFQVMQTSSDSFVIADAIGYLGSSGNSGRQKLLEVYSTGTPELKGAIGRELITYRKEMIPLLIEVIKNQNNNVSNRISACMLAEKILDTRNMPSSYQPLVDRADKKESVSFNEMVDLLKSLLKGGEDINLRRKAAVTLGSIADAETIIGLRSLSRESPQDNILASLIDLAVVVKEKEIREDRTWWAEQAVKNKNIKDIRFELFLYAEKEKELKAIMALSEQTPKVLLKAAAIEALELEGYQADISRRKTCKNVDLTKTSDGKATPGLGVQRHQGPLGWCYAHSAADLIGHKMGKDISAVDLAVNYIIEKKNKPENDTGVTEKSKAGGWSDSVLKMAAEKGVCAEESLKSSYEIARVFLRIEKLAQRLSELETGHDNCLMQRTLDLNEITGPLGLSSDQLVEMLKKTSLANLVPELVAGRCQPRLPFCGWVPKNVSVKTPKEKFGLLDKILDRGDIMGIAYYSDVLSDERPAQDGAHASTIVARRWNDQRGECEYLIRNSWGSDCSSYAQIYDCFGGNVWIPDRAIAKAVYRFTWLEESGLWDSVCRLWQ